jgi:hypothetical protein
LAVETLGAARLAKRIPAQSAVATIVPREEIAAVLEDREGSPELSLPIISEGHESEPSVIAMSWSRDELARVLEEATGTDVVLTFDREELSRAIDDVEAHGLRERALVFAVAATGVLGTGATIANAMPADVGGGSVVTSTAPAVSATDVSSTGGYNAVAGAPVAADTMVSDAASGAGYVAPASVPEASAAALGVTDVSSAGGYTAPASTAVSATGAADTMVSDAASGTGYAAPTAGTGGSAAGATVTDAASSGGYGTVEATSSSPEVIGIPRSDVTDGLIAGGILLAIAGATFASRHTGTTRTA